MHTLTLEKPSSIARDFALVLLASFIICLSGKIAIPLWFTPVPIATQNAVVLLMAALLGSRRGAAATFAFLAQGAFGLPVFSEGLSGVAILVGPTGGYLIGYLVASFAVGYMVENRKNLTASLAVGNLIIFACGTGYLATYVGLSKAFLLGVAPFILGDVLKTIASLKLISWYKNRQASA